MREQWKAFTQPNGSQIFLTKRGDARFHWLENRAGYVVVKSEESGFYEFAEIETEAGKTRLAPTGIPVNQDAKSVDQTKKYIKAKDLHSVRKQLESKTPH